MIERIPPNSAVVAGAMSLVLFLVPLGAALCWLQAASMVFLALGIALLLLAMRGIWVCFRSGVRVTATDVVVVGWLPARRFARSGATVIVTQTPMGVIRATAEADGRSVRLGVLAPLHGHRRDGCGYCQESEELLARLRAVIARTSA